jgi:hypothetical protein
MTNDELFISIQEDLLITSEQAKEGELSNLDALIKMRKAKEKAEKVLEIVKNFEDDRFNEITNEAESYKGIYCGFEIKSVNGRKMYNFKGISEIEEKEVEQKQLKEKYQSAFDGFQKGTVQTVVENDVRYWIDDNGELKPFPELTIGKSYLTVKQKQIKN